MTSDQVESLVPGSVFRYEYTQDDVQLSAYFVVLAAVHMPHDHKILIKCIYDEDQVDSWVGHEINADTTSRLLGLAVII